MIIILWHLSLLTKRNSIEKKLPWNQLSSLTRKLQPNEVGTSKKLLLSFREGIDNSVSTLQISYWQLITNSRYATGRSPWCVGRWTRKMIPIWDELNELIPSLFFSLMSCINYKSVISLLSKLNKWVKPLLKIGKPNNNYKMIKAGRNLRGRWEFGSET